MIDIIQNSFIFLDKVGPKREQLLWKQGIRHWDDFHNAKTIAKLNNKRKPFYERQLQKAHQAIKQDNSTYFKSILKNGDMWRIYNEFKDNAVFLDIETTGYYGDITVIGMYDGEETKTMVKGFNLDKPLIQKALKHAKLLLTFNGSSFDLPVIEKYFQGAIPNIPHIDLRHVCSKIGLVGGLKSIEKQTGIKRAEELSGIDGSDAVYLWEQWKQTGNRKHLNTLVQYNEEDIINLKPLANLAINQLWNQLHGKKTET